MTCLVAGILGSAVCSSLGFYVLGRQQLLPPSTLPESVVVFSTLRTCEH